MKAKEIFAQSNVLTLAKARQMVSKTILVTNAERPVGNPVMPSNDSDYWDEQKAFFKRYE